MIDDPRQSNPFHHLPEPARCEECPPAPAQQVAAQLTQAATRGDWSAVGRLAQQVLSLLPDHRQALSLQRVAKRERDARPKATADRDTSPPDSNTGCHDSGAARVNDGKIGLERATEADGNRFLMWIDGVGGYLVCMSPEVTLGQAIPGDRRVEVPILGDVSRRHAVLRREADRYILEPLQAVSVNQRPAEGKVVLRHGDELDLGSGVRVRFHQPHPLSASARLEFLGRHRLQSAADGVLLMAESCVLGPQAQNHVVCRDWRHEVVLYRRDGRLYCRSALPIEVDGQACKGQAVVGAGSRIDGEDFSLSLEPA